MMLVVSLVLVEICLFNIGVEVGVVLIGVVVVALLVTLLLDMGFVGVFIGLVSVFGYLCIGGIQYCSVCELALNIIMGLILV